MTLIGSYYHALEQKGRLSIPAVFRKQLGSALILTLGLDGGLFVFDQKTWQRVIESELDLPFTSKKARDFIRIMTNNAQAVEIDSLGRILIPERLRLKAGLTKQVVVVGSLNRLEIWDQQTYHSYLQEIEKEKEDIAEALSQLHAKETNNEPNKHPT